MCCFLICFYNPNKFVSHTPRLEKGVVLQFRIAVCSQLRQRICCKAVAARKRRSPAVLRLHRCWPLLCTRTATTSPIKVGKGSPRSALLQAGVPGKAAEQPHAPVSPPAGKDTVALQGSPRAARALHRHHCAPCCCLLFLQVLRQAQGSVASPKHPGSDHATVWGRKPLADIPSAVSSAANCILLSPPVPDSSLARKVRKKLQLLFLLMATEAQPCSLQCLRRCRSIWCATVPRRGRRSRVCASLAMPKEISPIKIPPTAGLRGKPTGEPPGARHAACSQKG